MRLALLAVAVALSLALFVAVAYAVVVIPDHDELGGNTLTTASLPVAGEPFATRADAVFLSPVFALDVEATQTLTLPAECSTTSPLSQAFAISTVADENTVPTAEWAVTCPAGEWLMSATVEVGAVDPGFYPDPDPSNNSMAASLTVTVE